MSSHHSEKCFNLHHNQVNAGKARREQRQVERLRSFLEGREQLKMEYNCMLGIGFICFAYTILATAVYLPWLV